jgi:phosphatidate cytidylyltransferase
VLTRIITGVVLAPALIALVLLGPLVAIFALFFIAAVLALQEFGRMALPAPEASYERLVGLATGAAPVAGAYLGGDAGLAAGMAVGAIAAMTALLVRPDPMETASRRAAMLLAGLAYVGVLFAFAVMLLHLGEERARGAIMLLFLTVWLGDTCAYFAGRALGRHKLYAKVSPKKTVEGGIGGMLGSIGGAFLAQALFLPELTVLDCIALGAGAGLLEQVGDFCESMFKRSFAVKDSGTLLPGHGGMLDRIDGLLFAAPLVYLYLR